MILRVTFVVSFILQILLEVSCWRLSIEHNGHRDASSNVFTLMCSADVPLTACVIRTYYDFERSTRVHNFTSGSQSEAVDGTAANGDRLYTARYTGTGLRSGQCGAVLSRVGMIRLHASCHVKAEQGGWQRATVSYHFWSNKHTLVPEPIVTQPGGNYSILCENEKLTQCWLDLPGTGKRESQIIAPYSLRRNSDVWYLYDHPSGSGSDVCSFTMLDMTDGDSGPVWCASYSSSYTFKTAIVIVSQPLESPPDVQLTSNAYYKQGNTLTASCEVKNTKPVANITWLLGSRVLRSDSLDDVDREVWRWAWQDRTITQHISYQLKPEDNNKDLICRASHLGTMKQSKIRIKFTEPPVCGKRQIASTLISRGHEAGKNEFPWHVGLYKLGEKTYQQQCGGSLITDNIVVTAAHCFTEVNAGRVPNMNLYKVLLGKHNLDYDHFDSGSQTRDVTNVTVPFDYIGFQGSYHYDIAIVRLNAKVKITSSVQTICLDWTNRIEATQLKTGNSGVVAGWGLTEQGTQGTVLQWVSLPWVSKRTCREVLPDNSLQFLSHDKFCAGYVNASVSVCAGDSGGGLVFLDPSTQSYYLRGIVSTSFDVNTDRTCFSQLYTGFTLVSEYIRNSFIKTNIN